MKKSLHVFKGYKKEEIESHKYSHLLYENIPSCPDIGKLNDDYKRQLMSKLMNFQGEKCIYYEEFILIQELGIEVLKLSNTKFTIHRNTIYPEYYVCHCCEKEILKAMDRAIERLNAFDEEMEIEDLKLETILKIYGDIKKVNDVYYVSYKNPERVLADVEVEDINLQDQRENSDYLAEKTNIDVDEVFEINSEVTSYLRLFNVLENNDKQKIGIKINDIIHFNTYYKVHFDALMNHYNNFEFYIIKHKVQETTYRNDFYDLLKCKWGFDSFKILDIYSNPDEDKTITKISQGQIIEDIVRQGELAIKGESFKDIFITAPTGAGKSIIFQIAALYLAQKYDSLTIIISPLIALMKDQVENLKKRGIYNAAYINSELNFIEKEEILSKIKLKEIDILYLAPETLLSYSIDNFIGDRKIGLFIVDEAHIVTTWGKGFRPDYWYLGKYLSRIRTDEQQFPIVTFTATAVYGGNDDMYDETVESLNMKSTIKYLGNIKRGDISFDVETDMKRYGKEEYELVSVHFSWDG